MENLQDYILQEKELKEVKGGGRWSWNDLTQSWEWLDD